MIPVRNRRQLSSELWNSQLQNITPSHRWDPSNFRTRKLELWHTWLLQLPSLLVEQDWVLLFRRAAFFVLIRTQFNSNKKKNHNLAVASPWIYTPPSIRLFTSPWKPIPGLFSPIPTWLALWFWFFVLSCLKMILVTKKILKILNFDI